MALALRLMEISMAELLQLLLTLLAEIRDLHKSHIL